VITASAVAYSGPGAAVTAPVRRRLAPGLSGWGDAGHVALTFDDGPDPAGTPAVLSVLAEWNVHATFFMLGAMAAGAPGLAREVAAAGHEIAVHGWVHRVMAADRPSVVYTDLARARDAVARATGQVPAWFRPPYGILTAGALAAARRLELRPLLWSSCGREWERGATQASVLARLLRTMDGGGTVLLHDSDTESRPGSAQAARAALPALLCECSRRGLTVGPVAEHGLAELAPGELAGDLRGRAAHDRGPLLGPEPLRRAADRHGRHRLTRWVQDGGGHA
jgi:peptidoglycan/xylan/chitin deacetylase (PgdA/CDA1 family)